MSSEAVADKATDAPETVAVSAGAVIETVGGVVSGPGPGTTSTLNEIG